MLLSCKISSRGPSEREEEGDTHTHTHRDMRTRTKKGKTPPFIERPGKRRAACLGLGAFFFCFFLCFFFFEAGRGKLGCKGETGDNSCRRSGRADSKHFAGPKLCKTHPKTPTAAGASPAAHAGWAGAPDLLQHVVEASAPPAPGRGAEPSGAEDPQRPHGTFPGRGVPAPEHTGGSRRERWRQAHCLQERLQGGLGRGGFAAASLIAPKIHPRRREVTGASRRAPSEEQQHPSFPSPCLHHPPFDGTSEGFAGFKASSSPPNRSTGSVWIPS